MRRLFFCMHQSGPGIGLLIFLAWSLHGCGGGYSASAGGNVLSSVAIVPASAKIINGSTAKLTAIGSYTNGTSADISATVGWLSAASAVANATNTGVVIANAIGTTTVTASISAGAGYGILSDSAIVTVTGASLTGITISPLTMTLGRGSTAILTATGAFSDTTNGNISGSVTWTSSDPAVASVSASGIATGIGAGTATITATLNAISNTATVTVF